MRSKNRSSKFVCRVSATVAIFATFILITLCGVRSLLFNDFVGWRWSHTTQRMDRNGKRLYDEQIVWRGIFSASGVIAVGWQEQTRTDLKLNDVTTEIGEKQSLGLFRLVAGGQIASWKSPDKNGLLARLGFECGTLSYPISADPKWQQSALRLRVPYWALMTLIAVMAVLRLKVHVTFRQRRLQGRCVGCGYDLRASQDRCPECGTAIGGGRGNDE